MLRFRRPFNHVAIAETYADIPRRMAERVEKVAPGCFGLDEPSVLFVVKAEVDTSHTDCCRFVVLRQALSDVRRDYRLDDGLTRGRASLDREMEAMFGVRPEV